jgi:hypothetical protein
MANLGCFKGMYVVIVVAHLLLALEGGFRDTVLFAGNSSGWVVHTHACVEHRLYTSVDSR